MLSLLRTGFRNSKIPVPIANDFSLGFRGMTTGVVNLLQPANLNINVASDNFSVSGWLKHGNDLAFQRCILSKARMNGGDVSLFVGVLDTTGAIYVLAGGGQTTSGGNVADGLWHHWCVTGAGGQIRLYLDGVQVGSTFTAGASVNSDSDWLIGGARYDNNADVSYPYKGQQNEITFWNVTLTPAQVLELRNAGVPINPTTHSRNAALTHWYQCGANDVIPTITDQVGGSNGTINTPDQVQLYKDSPTFTSTVLDNLSTGFARDLAFDATAYGGSGDWSASAGGWTGVLSGTPTRQVTSLFAGRYEITTAGNTWFRLADDAAHAIKSNTAVTYCLRMYTGALNGSGGFYAGYDAQGTVADLQIYNLFYAEDAAARIRQAGGSDYLICENHVSAHANKYVTVHVVVDIPNTTLKVYVNGSLISSDTVPDGSFTAATTAPFGILGNGYLSSGGFNSTASGQAVMEVVRYQQVLTDNEIARQVSIFNALKGYL